MHARLRGPNNFLIIHQIINIVLSKIDENRCKQTVASLP